MVNSAAVPGRPRSRDAAGLPAVTPDRIVAAALELTASQGLDNWTLRQLAAAVDAYPAVIYHHVGDREAVVRAVVQRVLAMCPVPPEDLEWREWFRCLFRELRAVLTRYPGVAQRLAVYGPTAETSAVTVDRGMRLLLEAGFGQESLEVMQFLSIVACQIISVEDARTRRKDLAEAGRETWSRHREAPDLPGLAAMGAAVHDLASDPERARDFFTGSFDYAMERCLDGLSVRLEKLKA